MNPLLDKLSPAAFFIIRLVAGYMFLMHGTAKFFEFPVSMTGGNGGVELFSLFGVAAVLEVVGGALMILGLFTRPTAFLLSGQMAYAYLFVHGAEGNLFQPMLNGGELAALYSVLFLMFFFVGAGRFSLDHKFFGAK